jgi:hypothetical protein
MRMFPSFAAVNGLAVGLGCTLATLYEPPSSPGTRA